MPDTKQQITEPASTSRQNDTTVYISINDIKVDSNYAAVANCPVCGWLVKVKDRECVCGAKIKVEGVDL